MDAKAARKKLLREAAFTWLSCFVAFRIMEERRLLRGTIFRLHLSGAYVSWVTEDQNAGARLLHDAGEVPANPMGEGPRHIAYRRFLLWQCGELARDVSILFDPGTLASRLCPRPPTLKQLVEATNAENLFEAWQTGNEESIGWVYQAFNAEELQAAFASAREQGKKFAPEDIPAVTQLFTIRWVVKFLVQNTLGRLWIEMHPDSRIKDKLDYYVLPVEERTRPLKLARDISFLDPACGSMHFGLVAFDLFADIYLEEFERAGEPGWSAEVSVTNHQEIAGSIIQHNLHGIDIDLRAVQLSALTLLLRARTLNPQCPFTDANLACANVEEMTGGRLEEFIKQAKFSHPIYERILRTLATRLKDSSNLGSLLRLDRDVNELVAAERKKAEATNQFLIGFPGLNPEQFKTQEGIEEFFDVLTAQIGRHLNEFVRATRQLGQDPGHFVNEAGKGVRFLSLVDQRYDVVATNPPYLSTRKMNKRLATLMAEEYGEAKGDLYAAFIVRCQELLNDRGLMGMLTMHSFMFISSYEDMRAKLRLAIAIQTMAHFGGGLFAVGMRSLAEQDEATYEFVAPCWESSAARSLERLQNIAADMQTLEREVDLRVYDLYGLSQSDRISIESEVGEAPSLSLSEPTELAATWISYAVGTVLGRFEIGIPGGLGRGCFPPTTVTAIRGLVDSDGIMPSDDGHPQDIAARTVKCLTLMLGVDESRDVIRTATGETGDQVEAVRGWLDRFAGAPDKSFWKYHLQLYRKRPIYWPLQSPRKKYTVWVFHEKFDKNTLFTVRNLVEERLRLLEREITDKRLAAGNNRRLAKEGDKLLDVADDLREFSKRIKEITDRGYTPHIDDGVLLNAAPLHPLLPSWPDTKTAWEELEAGDYDWAQQAMEYWPARVKAACQTNKSFAIAHGLA